MKKIDVNPKVLIALVALFTISISLMAQPGQRQRPYPPNDQKGFPTMDLSDEQKAEIKEIQLARTKEIQPLKDELRINKAKINALVHKDNPDMQEVVSLVEANGKILTQIQVKNIESRIKVRGLLTDEQKVIFDAHSGRMKGHRALAQHRPGRGFPGRSRF